MQCRKGHHEKGLWYVNTVMMGGLGDGLGSSSSEEGSVHMHSSVIGTYYTSCCFFIRDWITIQCELCYYIFGLDMVGGSTSVVAGRYNVHVEITFTKKDLIKSRSVSNSS